MGMEGRARRPGGQASPEPAAPPSQAKIAPPSSQARKIPVVYYLCRNRHLEHPHFIEVPLSSPDGLYLRDVINRLNALRGKGMPGLYSWSCKRSYKNGFVWHDLAEDDLVLPANGNEYVLKGSELLDQSPSAPHSDRIHQGNGNPRSPILKSQQQENSTFSRTQEHSAASFSPASSAIKDLKPPPPRSPPSSLDDEHSASTTKAEFRAFRPFGAADASTQTEDRGEKNPAIRGCGTSVAGISTDEGLLDLELDRRQPSGGAPRSKDGLGTGDDEISPAATSSSASSSSGKTETLESLIRADAGKINSFRILEEEEVLFQTGPKLRPTNVLMQLITCGSISVKDHQSFGLIPTYKPRFSHAKFPSPPMFRGSVMFGELDCLSEDRRLLALRLEDKEYFSGSLIETKKHKDVVEELIPTLKRSSSYNADRNCRATPESKQDTDMAKLVDSSRSKCLPRALKLASNKQARTESFRSCSSDGPRKSSAGPDCREPSKGESRRITTASSAGAESLKEKGEKMIKIEERLISGARVTIQSRAPCQDSEGSDS